MLTASHALSFDVGVKSASSSASLQQDELAEKKTKRPGLRATQDACSACLANQKGLTNPMAAPLRHELECAQKADFK
eukprot:1944217-Amphidinium_carterae.1